MHNLFNYLLRDLIFFNGVELVFSIWQVSNVLDLQHVHVFIFNPWIPVANMRPGIKKNELIRHFWVYSASKKISFGFCSCSELLPLKFGKTTSTGKCILLSAEDSYMGKYGGKWKIFTISTTLWKGFNMNLHVM